MNFQTPENVCDYMVSLLPRMYAMADKHRFLEPTPGEGNLVRAIEKKNFRCICPEPGESYWDWLLLPYRSRPFDAVCMNPPFTPMAEGWRYMENAMELTDNIVALLPFLLLINSDKRMKKLFDFGLLSVTHLPRKTFPDNRVQCCIVQLQRGFSGKASFKSFP